MAALGQYTSHHPPESTHADSAKIVQPKLNLSSPNSIVACKKFRLAITLCISVIDQNPKKPSSVAVMTGLAYSRRRPIRQA